MVEMVVVMTIGTMVEGGVGRCRHEVEGGGGGCSGGGSADGGGGGGGNRGGGGGW